MMKKESVASKSLSGTTAFGLSAVLGLIAFVLFWANGQKVERQKEMELGRKQQVIVADAEILPGREITVKQVREEKVYALMVQTGALTRIETVLRRVAQVPILPGQQILETMLHEEGGGFLSLRVGASPERRAVTLKMDGEGILAGLIKPGDVVDIMGVFEASAGAGGVDAQPRNRAIILAQAIKVLAVDQVMSEFSSGSAGGGIFSAGDTRSQGGRQSALVTFEVDAEQAWELGLASRIAHLRCLLRHRLNTEKHNYPAQLPGKEGIDSDKMFGAGGRTIQNIAPIDENGQ